jgi:monolysocardiolipin acyltransferase
MTMAEIGALCRGFLLGLSKLEVNGLESFTELLDSRRDHTTRTRGLITGKFFSALGSSIVDESTV